MVTIPGFPLPGQPFLMRSRYGCLSLLEYFQMHVYKTSPLNTEEAQTMKLLVFPQHDLPTTLALLHSPIYSGQNLETVMANIVNLT